MYPTPHQADNFPRATAAGVPNREAASLPQVLARALARGLLLAPGLTLAAWLGWTTLAPPAPARRTPRSTAQSSEPIPEPIAQGPTEPPMEPAKSLPEQETSVSRPTAASGREATPGDRSAEVSVEHQSAAAAATVRPEPSPADRPPPPGPYPPLPEVLADHPVATEALQILLATGLGVTGREVPPVTGTAEPGAGAAPTAPAGTPSTSASATSAAAPNPTSQPTADRARIFTAPDVTLRSTMKGVYIATVGSGMPDQLRPGDRLLRVAGERVLSAAQARALLRGRSGSKVTLYLRRQQERFELQLRRP